MHIVALAESPEHVSVRYRIDPVRRMLASAGHRFDVEPMPRRLWGRLQRFRRLRDTDMVIVQRRLISTAEVALLRRYARRLVFDFDDALFRKDSYHRRPASLRRMARFAAMVRAADHVFAGNEFLASEASRHTSPSKIQVVPTCVDLDRYHPAGHVRQGEGVRLVWIGSSSTLRGLELQRLLWEEVCRALPGLELRLICDRFPAWNIDRLICIPWSEATEAQELAECDIGLSWLPDDDWSRGKCGLKVLQYLAAGLPVVANPVGLHQSLVLPGETGFCADRAADWIGALSRLMYDPQLRAILGGQGRLLVQREYSLQRLETKWKSILPGESSRSSAA
jgi:glycosyltransferase involved in cell wall biosynthesis